MTASAFHTVKSIKMTFEKKLSLLWLLSFLRRIRWTFDSECHKVLTVWLLEDTEILSATVVETSLWTSDIQWHTYMIYFWPGLMQA